MKVRALQMFAAETGTHSAGDVFEMADDLAVLRIKAGLVVRVADKPETATRSAPEKAVTRRGKR